MSKGIVQLLHPEGSPLISAPKKWTFQFCTTEFLMTEFSLEKINQFVKDAGK